MTDLTQEITTDDIGSDKVLMAALQANVEKVVVIGEAPDGSLYFATASGDLPLVNFLLDKAKSELFRHSQCSSDEEEEDGE